MRLKIIFFPLVLIVSITIFISFILPQLRQIKQLNNENLAKKTELDAASSKQDAINTANSKITNDTDGGFIVKEYLPEGRSEEQIIAGVNYLANDANVVISNISLSDNAGTPMDSAAPAPIPVPTPEAPGNASATVQTEVVVRPAVMKTTSAKISIVGDYAKIRIFLDGLEHMPIINTVKSLNISKQEAKSSTDQTTAVDSGTLAVDIVADFGYMEVSKANASSVTGFKSEFDADTIGVLKKYISQKSQFVPNSNEVKGKNNPFLAN